jgi:dimeric dUTPase (all-alpha-NTP-PPase superfamily)
MTWNWLASTKVLQEAVFGQTFPKEGDELADYVTWNATALLTEVGEALNELGWKNWASPRGWVNREQFVGELVDVAHFLANMAVAVGVTDAEWQRRYVAKQEVNRQRQRDGYDGVSGKCPGCRRSYDDKIACWPQVYDEQAWCGQLNQHV